MVEESTPGGGLEEEIVFRIEDEVQIVPPSVPSHQIQNFIKTLPDSSPHYDRVRKKRPVLPVTASNEMRGAPVLRGSLRYFRGC